MILVAELKKLQ